MLNSTDDLTELACGSIELMPEPSNLIPLPLEQAIEHTLACLREFTGIATQDTLRSHLTVLLGMRADALKRLELSTTKDAP